MAFDKNSIDDVQFYSELLRAYFDSTGDAIFVLCDEMKFINCNKKTQSWLGISEEELTRHNHRIPITELFGHTDHKKNFTKAFKRALDGEDAGIEIYIIPKKGDARWLELSMRKVNIEAGDMVVVVARDISERIKHLAIIDQQAYYDPLTGLHNKESLINYIRDQIDENINNENPLTLICLDLDKFKEVNESLGQGIGDAILQEIASRLRNISDNKTAKMLSRMGGDEFALVFTNKGITTSIDIAKEIKEKVVTPINIASKNIVLDCSIGIVAYPTHTMDSNALVQMAEATMYYAKLNNTGISVYNPETALLSSQRIQLITELRDSLKKSAIKAYYQPILNINYPEIIHIEALAKWKHCPHGTLSTETFIKLAEENNLISDLTAQIINQSFAECSTIINDKKVRRLSINISPYCLTDSQLFETIKFALDKNSIPASSIVLEITESAMMSSLPNTKEVINSIHELGVNFSIDDFGTGHSSLFKLKQLPLSELKIDKAFIQDIIMNSDDMAITHASIQMAHSLGLTVVAEGIENEETWEELKRLGCDFGQGFWMAEAMPFDELKLWLKNHPQKPT